MRPSAQHKGEGMSFSSSILRAIIAAAAGLASGGFIDARLPAAIYASGNDHLPILPALQRDLGTALTLIERQLAEPFKNAFGLPILLITAGVGLLIVWPFRLGLLHRFGLWLQRLPLASRVAIGLKAVGTVFITTLLVFLAVQTVFWGLDLTVRLLPATEPVADALSMGLGIAGLGLGLGRALDSPDAPEMRPLRLCAELDGCIGKYALAAGIMLGVTNVIDQASHVIHANNTSWTIAQGLIALIETILVARFLAVVGRAREQEAETGTANRKSAAAPAIFGATVFLWLALGAGVAAFVSGHVQFSMLILQELLWAGLVLTIAWLIAGFIDAALVQWSDAGGSTQRIAGAAAGIHRARLRQIALLTSAVLTVLVWLFALGLVAAPLHGDNAVVIEQIRPMPLLNSLRSLDLSPRSVGLALCVLVVGIALTRMFRGWLENRFLPSTSLDIGVRTSLATGLTYIGTLIALLGATNMLGLQLEKITLIASALSVGIGFGLQSIIQNFVSGVILLIERPVKPGDWVSVSGAEGTIRKIRVRATELAMADGGIAIVPNSSFISSNVANRDDTLMANRLDLTLTVSGGVTVAAARDMVLEMLKGFAPLRDEPAPRIYLKTLGDAEWVFDIKAYAKSGMGVAQTRSDLLFWLAGQGEGREIRIRSN